METVARMSYNLDHYGRSHRNGETKADDDEPEPHLHKNNDNNGSESRSLCHEKMPLLTLDEKTCRFDESTKADNRQISIEQQRPSVHKISHLSKTFTEPINLSYFSQCIKNVDVKGNNDAKKSLIDSKNSSKITLIDEREDNRRESRKGDDDVDYNMSYSKDEQCAKNSKMMKSWRVLERGTKVGALCSHCPRCCSSAHGPLLTSVNVCSCRICRLLHDGLMPKYSLPHENFNREEYGAMCQICGQAESLTTSSDTNRCPLKTSLSSPQVAHLLSKAPRKESATSVRVLEGSVQESSRPGVIASREQGVQVSKWSLSSTSSSNVPLCRICHSPGDKTEPLMSPCRCSGSLQFVHSSCLLRWLDISRRKSHRSPHCELCGYKYQRHKTIRIRKFQCPPCCRRDKFLHVTFILAVLIMFACATLTVISFESQRNNKYVRKGPNEKVELNSQEVITLVCGIMFFCAFFLAMYVQVKAQATIYRWMTRFWMMNQEWEIEEYRPERDPEYFRANKHRLISRYNNNNNVKNDENVNNGSRRPSTKPTTGRQENSDTAATSDDAPDDDRIPRFSTV